MEQKLKGIVLHTIKYSDSSIIVNLYTAENGRTSLLAPIVRSRKSLIKSSAFQPLTLLDLEIDYRPKSTLNRIKEAKIAIPFKSIPFHPIKSAIALFIAEFLHKSLQEESQNLPLFTYLHYSIQWLDECKQDFANFHLVFLMRLSRFIGLYPNTEAYHEGDYFDLQNACFCSHPPFHRAVLSPEEAGVICKLMRMNYETMHLFKMNRTQRNRCLTVINDYYRLHLPNFPEFKSIGVLQELFS